MDVHHAQTEVLGVAAFLEKLQHIEAAIGRLQVEVIDREIQHARVDVFKGAITNMRDEVSRQAIRHDVHGFDGDG